MITINRNKKAFAMNQLFILLGAVMVIGLVLFMGVRATGLFQAQSCEIQYLEMQREIENVINDVAQDFGSRRKLDVRLVCDVTQVCFGDGSLAVGSNERNTTADGIADISPLAGNIYELGDANIFLFADTEIVGEITMENLEVLDAGNSFYCQTSQLQAYRIDGVGRKARMQSWVS